MSGPKVILFVCSFFLFLSSKADVHAFEFVAAPGTFPRGLATDGANLWLSDFDTNKIYQLDSDGVATNSFDFTNGSPRGLTYNGGVLFVATATRIYRLDAETGAYLADFASPDPTSPDQQGLAYGDGKLWVASRGSDDRVYGMNPTTGVSVIDFPTPGTNPRGLTYFSNAVWNLDSSDDTLYELSGTNGTQLRAFNTPLGNPRGLTYFDGHFIQTDETVDLLMRIELTNTFSTVYVAPSQYVGPSSTLWLPYISTHPLTETNTAITRILWFQHGVSDNCVEYFARAYHAAVLDGSLDETLIVSFQLLDDNKLPSAPPTNMVYWTGGRFWGGLSANAVAPYPRSERVSAYTLLDTVLAGLTTNAALFPALNEIVISGHSGGGQFVNRYAATSPFERTILPSNRAINVHYIVMNPSSYMYFNELRVDLDTLDIGGGVFNFVAPTSTVPSVYNAYGYGLQNLSSYQAGVGSNNIVSQYPGRKVIYLIGDADTGLSNLDTNVGAVVQGSNRYDRCLVYYEHLKSHFSASNLPRHRLAAVPGVGHDGHGMITSPLGLTYHFQGPLLVSNFVTSGMAPTMAWGGGDGLVGIETSTNLIHWELETNTVSSPWTDNDLREKKFYRFREAPGP